ncbi:MAG TPA: Fe-S cluster assembly protein SufD [Tepidisphaeraceae bacterium]|nr:Fe-S cluster assembly protein SufD [Tepidisphaeraceae bacterium]
MTQLAEHKDTHWSHYRRAFERSENGSADFVGAIRKAGIEQFDAVGFPTTAEEEWRLTSLQAIARQPFALAEVDYGPEAAALARQYSLGADAAVELVIVNGNFAPQLSRMSRLPRGVVAGGLAAHLAPDRQAIEKSLGNYAKIEDNPFIALNAGFLRDGAYVSIPAGIEVERPIHLLFVCTANDAVAHPRTLVTLGENSRGTIVESYVGGSAKYWTNAVTEILVRDSAVLDHCKLQQESKLAFHIATMAVNLGRGAAFVSHSATLGGLLTRNNLNVVMGAPRAEATLNGLVIIGGRQHADNHTLLDHAEPDCASHELYKHVLSDSAVGVFKGKILVRRPAQKTDSKQTSKSLLLSDQATMNSQPALEIYADDVKCTHGSTTGPVDEEMVFYLRSRGVDLEASRHLLSYAFAADITRRIRVAAVRERLEDFLSAQHGLPRDLRITDLGAHDEKAR